MKKIFIADGKRLEKLFKPCIVRNSHIGLLKRKKTRGPFKYTASICKFWGVNFTSGGERSSFEKPFLLAGQIREESVKWGQLNTIRDFCTFAILCSVTRPFLSPLVLMKAS